MLLRYNKEIRSGRRLFLQYPCNGQKTRSNGRNSNKNNKILIKHYIYIYTKFYKFVYHVNGIIFFRAQEYNKLFFYNWTEEWYESMLTSYRLIPKFSKKIHFNFSKASIGQIDGYARTGAAGRRGKARSKIFSVSTGVPINMLNAFIFNNKKIFNYSNTTK